MNLPEELATRLQAEFQKFRHDNNRPETRERMEKAAAKVLADFLTEHPEIGPKDPIRVRRLVIRPGQRLEVDLVVPAHLVEGDPEDVEGEEWKS